MVVLRFVRKQILIMGYGAIGSAIHAVLKKKYSVQVYDKKIYKKDIDEHLRVADMIIGCTGETSLPFSKYKYLKKRRMKL